MRAQNLTPEFARDVKQMYPDASINDLITMRIFGVKRNRYISTDNSIQRIRPCQ